MTLTIRSGSKKLVMGRPEGTLLDAIQKAKLPISASCGGVGSCGKCTVFLEKGDFRVCGEDLSIESWERREELACLTQVCSEDALVAVPQVRGDIDTGAKIQTAIQLPEHTRRPAARWVDLSLLTAEAAPGLSLRERAEAVLKEASGLDGFTWTGQGLEELASGPGRDGGPISFLLSDQPGVREVLSVARDRAGRRALGAAVDIGTSTVALALVDLSDGRVLERVARYNQQVLHADDVASRISLCKKSSEVAKLRELVVRHTINPLLAQACEQQGVSTLDVVAVAVAANTVMSHLFLGLSPLEIGHVPFLPVTRSYPVRSASRTGLTANPAARVYVVPSASGYVGGDILADLAVARFDGRKGTQLLVDIGTNGEMVLLAEGRFTACATAAGPAFEGAGLRHGCRAVAGAIDQVRADPDGRLRWHALGDAPPVGLCGSGVVDFLAAALGCGLLNKAGRFDVERLKALGCYEAVRLREGVTHALRLVDEGESSTGEPLVVTEYDVAQVLKAKGAIYAGLKTLLHARGLRTSDLDRVVLAGGFAQYLNLESAIAIGLLPDLPRDRYEIIGNGSLAGAALALLDVGAREDLERWKDRLAIVELNREPSFANHFTESMVMPYLEPGEFSQRQGG